MSPKREAEIWRLVLVELQEGAKGKYEGALYLSLRNQPYICTLLDSMQGVTSRDRSQLQGKIRELLGDRHPTLQSWVVSNATPEALGHEHRRDLVLARDPGLLNTRIAWVTWLAEQAEARKGGRRGQ